MVHAGQPLNSTAAISTSQLDELLDELAEAEVDVTMARVRQPVRDMLERSGLLERTGVDAIFLEVDDAVEAIGDVAK